MGGGPPLLYSEGHTSPGPTRCRGTRDEYRGGGGRGRSEGLDKYSQQVACNKPSVPALISTAFNRGPCLSPAPTHPPQSPSPSPLLQPSDSISRANSTHSPRSHCGREFNFPGCAGPAGAGKDEILLVMNVGGLLGGRRATP